VDGSDAVSQAAKRVFGIADTMLIERRAADLVADCDVPMDALDLALANWGADTGRAAQGADPGATDADVLARASAALGVGAD
jgi:hypothetical protein